jgi:hypothetical protein
VQVIRRIIAHMHAEIEHIPVSEARFLRMHHYFFTTPCISLTLISIDLA